MAFFQHGFLDQAADSFQQVIAEKPNDPDAYYNLGTLCLRRNATQDARKYLDQALNCGRTIPKPGTDLGMLAAQAGQPEEAIQDFQQSAAVASQTTPLPFVNLGNVFRRQGNVAQATTLLNRALENEPTNPEVNYSLGMLYARSSQNEKARQYLETAINLRPDYADALNNLGVLFVQQQRYPEAEEKFKACIRIAPNFDQSYLNLARPISLRKTTTRRERFCKNFSGINPNTGWLSRCCRCYIEAFGGLCSGVMRFGSGPERQSRPAIALRSRADRPDVRVARICISAA